MHNFNFKSIFGNNSVNSTSKAKKQRRGRTCRIEELENREMLSVTPWSLADDVFNLPQPTDNDTVIVNTPANQTSPALAPLAAAPPVNANPAELSQEEFDYLREEKYVDLNLSADMAGYNVTVITADELSQEALQNAIHTAAMRTGNELIVLRTTDTDNKITLSGAELWINIDATEWGSITIISMGDENLTIDANQQSRVLGLAIRQKQTKL